jgi:hypothetical protein
MPGVVTVVSPQIPMYRLQYFLQYHHCQQNCEVLTVLLGQQPQAPQTGC